MAQRPIQFDRALRLAGAKVLHKTRAERRAFWQKPIKAANANATACL